MAELLVRDLMRTDVAGVRPSADFKTLAELMADHQVWALPVVDSRGRVAGVVSESDLVRLAAVSDRARPASHSDEQTYTAGTIMTAPAVAVEPDEPARKAARLLADAGLRQLVVATRDGLLVGVLSRDALLAAMVRPDEMIEAEIVDNVLLDELCIDPGTLDVIVREGTVTLRGQLENHALHEMVVAAVRGVLGVVGVEDHLTWPQPAMRMPTFPHAT